MAFLLLHGCLAPVHSTAAQPLWRAEMTVRLLPRRRPSRFGAIVASAATASSPSGGDGATVVVLRGSNGSTAKAYEYVGTNGAVSGTAKSTSIETTVERKVTMEKNTLAERLKNAKAKSLEADVKRLKDKVGQTEGEK